MTASVASPSTLSVLIVDDEAPARARLRDLLADIAAEVPNAVVGEAANGVLALEAIVEPISLHEPAYSDGGDTIFVMDQVGDKQSDKDWLDEISLKEAIENLGEREKKILSLRFFVGKTQMEVAQEIGISQAQVSRLEKSALNRIKKQI